MKRLFKGQKGISLIETVVALGLLAYIGVATLMAMQTNYKATGILDERVVADNLATASLEAVRQSLFADTYASVEDSINDSAPSGYDVAIDTFGTNDDITWVQPCAGHTLQKITVTVSHGGNSVLSMSTYRANR